MSDPRFGKTVETVAKEILEPLGFRTVQSKEAGYAPLFSFVKPWKEDYLAGIGVYAAVGKRAFAVELGVIPDGQDFYSAAHSEAGPWKKVGLRKRLGVILQPGRRDLDPFDRDFFEYHDQQTLLEELRRAILLALEHGPAMWEKMGSRLLTARQQRA